MARLHLAPALLLVFAAQVAQAGPIWGYRSPTNTSILSPGSAAGLTFPNTSWADADGSQSIVVTPVQQWSVALTTDPDRVAAGEYSLGLEIRDDASGATGTLNFSGTAEGTIWKDGASLTNRFTGTTTKALDLGDYRYEVALGLFEGPTGFGEKGAGKITADVTVTALSDPPTPVPPVAETPDGPTAQTPEPATFVLGALGLGTVVLARLRRKPSTPSLQSSAD